MSRRIALIAMAALALIATGCKKKHHPMDEPGAPGMTITILGAPESVVLVGEKFTLNVEIPPEYSDVGNLVWRSSDSEVAKVDAYGHVLATGKGDCEISVSAGRVSDKVAISVNDRDPGKDQMGHTGISKTSSGQNNGAVVFNIGNTAWKGYLWYQGGNNSMTYYDNGTFKSSWSGTNDFISGVGYSYGSPGVNREDMQYDCYFRHSKTGSAGGYSYIGIHGWTIDPLVEFYIIDDWYNKPGANLLGQKKGEFVIDGDTYEIYMSTRVQQPSIAGTATFPQYFSVRKSSRQSGHINATGHFKKWESLGMKMGNFYELLFFIEAGGGTGSLDCTYFFMSDGEF